MSATRDVISYAKGNGGVFTTADAIRSGLSHSTLSRRVDDGVFVRLGRGLFSLPGTSTRPDVTMRAAGHLLNAVVSHESAARLHGMGPLTNSVASVTVSHRGSYAFPGLTVHQSTDLLPEHTQAVGPLQVTIPSRTLIDLAKVTGEKRLERIIDNALAAGLVEFDDLMTLFLSLTRQGKTGMKKLRRILTTRADTKAIPPTVIERNLFHLLAQVGVRLPEREFHAPWLKPIDGRVDFAYVDERIVIEADSRRWHALFEAFETDRRRDIAAQLAGWVVLRFTWRMLTEEPEYVVGAITSALTQRSSHFSR